MDVKLNLEATIYRDGEALTTVPENTQLGAVNIAEAFGANAVATYHPTMRTTRYFVRRRSVAEWKRANKESFLKRVPGLKEL